MDNLDFAIEASENAHVSIRAAEIACDAAIVAAANGNDTLAAQQTSVMKSHLDDYESHTERERNYLDQAHKAEQAEAEEREIYAVTNGSPNNRPRLLYDSRYHDISRNSIAVRLIAARVTKKLQDLHGFF